MRYAANAGRTSSARYTLRVPTVTGGYARFTRLPPAVNCRPYRATDAARIDARNTNPAHRRCLRFSRSRTKGQRDKGTEETKGQMGLKRLKGHTCSPAAQPPFSCISWFPPTHAVLLWFPYAGSLLHTSHVSAR